MMHLLKEFEKGNTILFQGKFRDNDGVLYNATSPTYEIQDKQGNIITSGNLTKYSQGIYYFQWLPTEIGEYIVIYQGTINNNPVTIRRVFRVVETGLNS